MNKVKVLITEKIEQRCIDRLKSKFSVSVEPELWQYPDRLKNVIPNYEPTPKSRYRGILPPFNGFKGRFFC